MTYIKRFCRGERFLALVPAADESLILAGAG